jgi:hypothetical protein
VNPTSIDGGEVDDRPAETYRERNGKFCGWWRFSARLRNAFDGRNAHHRDQPKFNVVLLLREAPPERNCGQAEFSRALDALDRAVVTKTWQDQRSKG